MTAGHAWEERPAGDLPATPQFGSDVIAATLRDLGIEYVALNPGASFRGLHDSLVNYLGNCAPRLLLCLHEEHAVAIAQGYAKVTGKPIAVAVHANVGLMHATMAIFNAWCDRMPVIVLGATGPVDAEQRRPWIDWIHTARDQGALVRDYVKWDDQPASPAAAREALLRAAWIAQTAPQAPVYVNFDAHLQEAPLAAPLPPIDAARYVPAIDAQVSPAALREAAGLLDGAQRPLILMGRVSRSQEAWDARVALAEALQAEVVTDLKVGAAFPTDHPLHVDAPSVILSSAAAAARAIAVADVILALDWVDLAGTLRTACGGESAATIINVSLDHRLHNGWSMDHQGLPPVDVAIEATPDGVVPALAAAITRRPARAAALARDRFVPMHDDAELTTDDIALALRDAVGARRFALAHLPLSWNGASWPWRGPLEFLGSDGGGGIGAGPGIAVGAALALRGSGVLPLAVCGDGDFLMGATALWTAVHYRIALLLIVANNRSFYNDEVHQERVARTRKRPVANKWIGQRISDPDIDLAGIARAQGAAAIGPVADRASLVAAIAASLAAVDAGQVAVIDVRVKPGYTPSMAAGLTPGGNRG
jgi:thiamine pyrophosphate-dependent acetolactate synthase large subunit-like protein